MGTRLSIAHCTEQNGLSEAVRLATGKSPEGGGPFGAIIMRDGEVIASGTNQVTPTLDPTAHAEVVAIRAACRAIGDFKLTGCVLVSSCEPCPLCLSTALWARVDRVLYAADRDDAAEAGSTTASSTSSSANPARTGRSIGQLSISDYLAPFDAWWSKPDKLAY
jgi:tRNA(Arg) A34 adenosine deaminase TadA